MIRHVFLCCSAVLSLVACHIVDGGGDDAPPLDAGIDVLDSGFDPTGLVGTSCGDGTCSLIESAWSCPTDCEAVCGDGVCTHTENTDRCPPDCPWVCGNGVCEGEETAPTCPGDCPAWCGDGACTHDESGASCPGDCPP